MASAVIKCACAIRSPQKPKRPGLNSVWVGEHVTVCCLQRARKLRLMTRRGGSGQCPDLRRPSLQDCERSIWVVCGPPTLWVSQPKQARAQDPIINNIEPRGKGVHPVPIILVSSRGHSSGRWRFLVASPAPAHLPPDTGPAGWAQHLGWLHHQRDAS